MKQIKVKKERRIASNSLYTISLNVFMILAMFVPSTYSVLRLLAFAMTFIISTFISPSISIEKKAFNIFGISILYNILCSGIGFINGFVYGAVRTLTVEFVWPIMYLVILDKIDDNRRLYSLIRLMVYMEVIISIFDIWYCLSSLGYVSFPSLFTKIDLDMHFGHYGAFIDFTTKHMCTHLFMVPFLGACIVFDTKALFRRKPVIWISFFLGVVCAFFSGRAAFQVITIMSVLFVIIAVLRQSTHGQGAHKLLFSVIVFGVIAVFIMINIMKKLDLDIWLILDFIKGKFVRARTGAGDNLLNRQAGPLIEGWLSSPLWGSGNGAYLSSIVRSDTMSWSYELGYLAMLFQKGVIGLTLFCLLNGYSIRYLYKKAKTGYIDKSIGYGLILGLISILACTAIDPYLGKMGCLWMEYLPFILAAKKVAFK